MRTASNILGQRLLLQQFYRIRFKEFQLRPFCDERLFFLSRGLDFPSEVPDVFIQLADLPVIIGNGTLQRGYLLFGLFDIAGLLL